MIRLLVKLGVWLDARFPAKVTITEKAYGDLLDRLALAARESDVHALNRKLEALERKVEAVGQAAVHKDAVRDVVLAVKQVKDDLASFKASMGFNRPQNADIQALLNGEVIGVPNENQ